MINLDEYLAKMSPEAIERELKDRIDRIDREWLIAAHSLFSSSNWDAMVIMGGGSLERFGYETLRMMEGKP